nr:hypothetical protein [Baekduia alba]
MPDSPSEKRWRPLTLGVKVPVQRIDFAPPRSSSPSISTSRSASTCSGAPLKSAVANALRVTRSVPGGTLGSATTPRVPSADVTRARRARAWIALSGVTVFPPIVDGEPNSWICVPAPASWPITATDEPRASRSGSTPPRLRSRTAPRAAMSVARARCAVVDTFACAGAGALTPTVRIAATWLRTISSRRAAGRRPSASPARSVPRSGVPAAAPRLPSRKLSVPALAAASVSRTASVASGPTKPLKAKSLRNAPNKPASWQAGVPLIRL